MIFRLRSVKALLDAFRLDYEEWRKRYPDIEEIDWIEWKRKYSPDQREKKSARVTNDSGTPKEK